MHRLIPLYVVGVGTAVLAIYASAKTLPATAVILLAVLTPIVPVFISHMLTRRKIAEVHVLVNSRLSTTLSDLKDALLENVRLKVVHGEPVPPEDLDKIKAVTKDLQP